MPNHSSLLETILGPEGRFTLRERLRNAALFSTLAAACLLTATDILQGLGARFYLSSFTICLLSGLMFTIGRRGGGGRWLVWCLFAMLTSAMVLFWYLMGGFLGATTLVAIAIVTAIPALLEGRERHVALGGMFLIITTIFFIEYNHPALISGYPDEQSHQRDIYFTLILMGSAMSLLMALVVYSYQRQRERTEVLNGALQTANAELEERNRELVHAFEEIVVLRGIIPICSHCKKVRNDDGFYEAVEHYIHRHSEADFSHTVCPDCMQEHYPEVNDPHGHA